MGSGSSQPKETQSAPATARATPKQAPKRHRQFEEVQIAGQGGTTPRSRQQQQRSQGPSPNPNQGAARTPRGQDPGASGSTSERTNRSQAASNRQGAAAHGRKPQQKTSNMPAQQNDISKKHILTVVQEESEISTKDKSTGNHSINTARPNATTKKIGHAVNAQNDGIKAGLGYQTTDKISVYSKGKKGETNRNNKNGDVMNHVGDIVDKRGRNDKSNHAVTENVNVSKGSNMAALDAGASNGVHPTSEVRNATNRMDDDLSIDDDAISYDKGEEFGAHDEDHLHDEHHWEDFDDHDHHDDIQTDPHTTTQQPGASSQQAETISMKDDDLVFETFYHRSGKEFQCIYQSGMRFYLDDWGSKEWQPFPKRWYNEGLLVTNTILKDENADQSRNDQNSGASQGQSTSRSQGRSQGNSGSGSGGNDDREGFLMHPSKGRVPTYIFYKKHNVHMYFDRDTGSWVRMPIGWELHHNMVKSLVDQVEEAVPSWGDRHDILALLRACNYDPDECISIYLHLEKDEWMKAPKTSKENKLLMEKEARILELEKRVKHLESQLQNEILTREEAERNLEEQMNKFSELEAESKETEAHLSAVTGGRPVSARPFSRMVKPGQKQGKGGKGVVAAVGGKTPQKSGEVVNPDDILDLNANAKELRKAHTRVKMDVERYMGDLKHMLEKLAPAIKQLKQSEKGTLNEIEEVRALYRKEALQRKLLYNQLQELRGNIRVFCRVRKDDRADCCMKFPSDQDVVIQHQQQGKKIFSFDKVFEPKSTQEQVFEDTKPIITSCVDGYNVCLLAYGQTGSGKTFTMMGPESNPGINIRAMTELFQVCLDRKETQTYTMKVSLVEIYNETIQDLLTNDAKTLELRTAGNKVQIPGLTEYPIKNIDDVKKVMAMGDKNRSVASTKMNSTSSRSHLVLMLNVEGTDKVTGAISRGSLVLCDLAGSERIAKTEAEGQRLVEAAAINKSLSALGQVFTALRSSQLHVPYRNSKLTQILQPSLGGDAKACLFVNVSPDSYNFAESVSTLTFGSNARQVTLGQAKQNITKGKQ